MPVETLFYELLNVSHTATTEEIKKAYRKSALIHHPDKGGSSEMFKKITIAYEVLTNPEKRNLYDTKGEKGLSQDQLAFNTENIFKHFSFGDAFSFFNLFQPENKPLIHQIKVTLEEICLRKIKTLEITRDSLCPCTQKNESKQCETCQGRGNLQFIQNVGFFSLTSIKPCHACNGKGKIQLSCRTCEQGIMKEKKEFQIFLTPDMLEEKISFPREGNQNLNCKERGELIISLQLQDRPDFIVKNKDLVTNVNVPLKLALVGFQLNVNLPTLEVCTIEISEVIKPESSKTIKGKGLTPVGDLIINFHVLFPESIPDSEKEILRTINL